MENLWNIHLYQTLYKCRKYNDENKLGPVP